MAVAIQPAVTRPMSTGHVPIVSAASRSPNIRRHKDDLPIQPHHHQPHQLLKPTAPVVTPAFPNNRSRRERPCDACRRRKSRCVIKENTIICVLCEFHKQDCTFIQEPQPRKRKVLGPNETKEANSKKRSVDVSSPQISKTAQQKSAPRKIANVPESRHLGDSLGLQTNRHGRYLGLSSPFEPLLIGLSPFDSRNESLFSLGTLRRVDDNATFIMLPDNSTQDFSDDAEALEAVDRIIQPHGPALLDLYFKIVHPCFPVIQKHVFVERYRNGERNFAPALIAGMYLLALNWWSFDENLSKHPRPDLDALDAIAMRSLHTSMKRPKLSTVQAGLLLLQRPETDSWSLTTQLVAIGQEIGLHLDCSTWNIPPWERGLRKRIAWALYMQDKWSSLIHGRPSHIFSANWAVKPIMDEDTTVDSQVNPNLDPETEDEVEAMEMGKILFSQMIALTGIMAEVMDSFYTQVAIQQFADAGTKSTQLILEKAKPVQIKLKEWFSNLPASVRMDKVTPGKLAPAGFMHLAYFATEITLHRRIIQSLNTSTSDPYLLFICRSAAKTRLISSMDFVNRLRAEHLQSFWYFPSKINFTLIGTFGALLWATAPAEEEASFYRSRLREYRWTLSVSSRRAAFLEYAVRMLDASRSMLRNLAEKPSLARVTSIGVPRRLPAAPPPPFNHNRMSNNNNGSYQEEEDVGGEDDADGDVSMEEAPEETPPLTRTTSMSNVSASVFSGFSDALEQFSVGNVRMPGPPTPPSSTG